MNSKHLFHLRAVSIQINPLDRQLFLSLIDEYENLRARLDVDEQDVDEADIGDVLVVDDSPQIVAWMTANGFEFRSHKQTDYPGIWLGDLRVWEGSPIPDERVINALAHAVGRAPLDVLDEIRDGKLEP